MRLRLDHSATTDESLEIEAVTAVAAEVEINYSPLLHQYTLEEFWELPDPGDRSHYELIGGWLFMVPPPDEPHGSIDCASEHKGRPIRLTSYLKV